MGDAITHMVELFKYLVELLKHQVELLSFLKASKAWLTISKPQRGVLVESFNQRAC